MIKEIFEKDVKNVNGKFYINLAKNTGGMVIVKAEWCGYCKRTMPELFKVSQLTGSMFPIFKIDSDVNKNLINKMGVQGFPTIFFIEKDGLISSKYSQDRECQKFLDEICSRVKKCF